MARAPRIPPRWRPLLWLAAGCAVAAAWLLLRPAPPTGVLPSVAGLPGCGFRLITGAPCPGCGMTRSLTSLLRGDAAAAFAWHPVGPVLAGLALTALALAAVEGSTGRPVLREALRRHGPRVAGWTVALLAICWTIRVVLLPDLAPDPPPPGSPAARLLGR